MSLKEFCKTQVVTVTSDQLVTEAAQLMRDNKVGDVVVVKNKKPIGLLTDRDIAVGCCLPSMASRIEAMTIEEIMSKDPVVAADNLSLFEVAKKMNEAGVARVPVVEAKSGNLIGIITAQALLNHLQQELTQIVGINKAHREAAQSVSGARAKGSSKSAAQQAPSMQ